MAKQLTLTAKQITRGLINYLDKTNRRRILTQVIKQAEKVSKISSDPNTAIVETTIPLNESQNNQLATVLSQKLNRPITIVNRLNPLLIAGFKLKIGDLLIDKSVNHQLDQLAAIMKN